MNLLLELKQIQKESDKKGLLIGATAATGLIGAKLAAKGKLAGLAMKGAKVAKVAKSGSGIIILDPKEKSGDKFEDHAKETVNIILRSFVISALLSSLSYSLYITFSETEEFDENYLFKMLGRIGITLSISTIAFKVLQQLLEKMVKFNNGKPLTRDQNAILITVTLGVTMHQVYTKLYDFSNDDVLPSLIISTLITYLSNSTLLSRLWNFVTTGKFKK